MSKRCVLVDPACHSAADIRPPVDWSKCILCQKQTREPLQCPANSRRHDVGAGYEFLAGILPEFDKLEDYLLVLFYRVLTTEMGCLQHCGGITLNTISRVEAI
jgi:hypothetical protein